MVEPWVLKEEEGMTLFVWEMIIFVLFVLEYFLKLEAGIVVEPVEEDDKEGEKENHARM